MLPHLEALRKEVSADEAQAVTLMHELVECVAQLCEWVSDSMSGDAHAMRHLSAAQTRAVAAAEKLPVEQFPAFSAAVKGCFETLSRVTQVSSVTDVIKSAQRISFPVIQTSVPDTHNQTARRGLAAETPSAKPAGIATVAKVMFELEGRPWSTPQLLAAQTIYDVSAKITIAEWPDWATRLVLDHVSTLDRDRYHLTLPNVARGTTDGVTEENVKGHVEIYSAQSFLSEPIRIRLLARFEGAGGRSSPVTIVGYHELRVRAFDPTEVPILSKYRAIDQRTFDLLQEVDTMSRPVDPRHRQDFIEALGAVTNFMGVSLQEAMYREGQKINESDFQRDLLRHMRLQLGEDVQEASKRGGGPTDIVYRSITIELKVEKSISDRRKMVEKYLRQPVQYSSAGGARLGVLCILDMTEKRLPPANPQNNITLEAAPVHGFPPGNAPYDTKIATVIIDGNLRLPSSYSR